VLMYLEHRFNIYQASKN